MPLLFSSGSPQRAECSASNEYNRHQLPVVRHIRCQGRVARCGCYYGNIVQALQLNLLNKPNRWKRAMKYLRMKCSALNVDFNGVRFDPLGSRSPPYERVKFGYPLENVRFLLLSTNLAREWLQIDTDLLRIVTIALLMSFPGVPTSMTLNDLEPQKYGFLVNFSLF